MDLRLVMSAFAAIFIAELGDKTQLATMAMAGTAESKLSIFCGAALALVATSALGVLVGGALSRTVPELWMNRGAGVMFIVIGLFYLFGR
ncbi:MAG: TMEM165/GDT1 family protein [Deltaproteobacteria bacterium]|nr:MAG: TMEM165/GDT1 family protein [Deltaproteobacteria bacterium]